MRARRILPLTLGLAALGCSGLTPGASAGEGAYPLLSHATDGILGSYAIGEDRRHASYAAFSSTATNVVAGRGGAAFDLFVVRRGGHYSDSGSAWVAGRVFPALRRRPNGNVLAPSLNGGFYSPANCVGFISNATNILPGNASGQYDGYVENLRTRRVTRVSLASNGAHANGPTDSISVDGQCERVTFSSTATNLAGGFGRLRSPAPAAGTDEVYVRVLGDRGFPANRANRGAVGRTFLVSAGNSGRPANGPCRGATMANFGVAVTYTCTASNLPGGADGQASQVYVTRLARGRGSVKARPLNLIRSTLLVSRAGAPGNALSDHAVISADGTYVTYHTRATNLFAGASGLGDVVRADVIPARPVQEWVSRGPDGTSNGASDHPSTDYPSDLLLFDSTASNIVNLGRAFVDDNNAADVFFWGSNDRVVKLRSRRCYTCPPLPGGSSEPVTSYVANYTLFRNGGQLWLRYIPA